MNEKREVKEWKSIGVLPETVLQLHDLKDTLKVESIDATLKWLFSMLNLKIHEESENEEEQIHDLLEKNKKENGVIL